MSQTRMINPAKRPAPSHSPPDIHYQPGLKMARFLGWFSIGLGAAELLAPRVVDKVTGVARPGLLKAYGVREIVCGIGALYSERPAKWIWARVFGDVVDLATLGSTMLDREEARRRACTSAIVVAGVTLLDLLSASELSAAEALEGN